DVRAREQKGEHDLDRVIHREPLAADGRARRLAAVAEELDEEVGRAVDDPRLIPESRRRVHEADELHALLHAVEVTQRVLHRGQARERGIAGGLVALAQCEVRAHHAGEIGPPILHRRGPRQVEHVAVRAVRDEPGPGDVGAVHLIQVGKWCPERAQLVLDEHDHSSDEGYRRGASGSATCRTGVHLSPMRERSGASRSSPSGRTPRSIQATRSSKACSRVSPSKLQWPGARITRCTSHRSAPAAIARRLDDFSRLNGTQASPVSCSVMSGTVSRPVRSAYTGLASGARASFAGRMRLTRALSSSPVRPRPGSIRYRTWAVLAARRPGVDALSGSRGRYVMFMR